MSDHRQRCRHCGLPTAYYRRRLCAACHRRPSVRCLYPPRHDFAPDRMGGRPLALSPIGAPPGTAERLSALRDRAALKLDLWHPDDAEANCE